MRIPTWVWYVVLLVLGVYYAGIKMEIGADGLDEDEQPQVVSQTKPVFQQITGKVRPSARETVFEEEETFVGAMPHYARLTLAVVLLWLSGMLIFFILGRIFSDMTLRLAEKHVAQQSVTPQETRLRHWYAELIEWAALYYYISLPLVVLLTIAVALAVIYLLYGFGHLGALKLKILFFVVTGAAITIYKLISSLFVKAKITDPGRALRPEEAPELFKLSKEVAYAVGTRAVDEIRLTPGTELAVYERGNWRARMEDRGERVLILGVALLEDLRQNAFRAVLAHEYGHFLHRDTAGGDMALRVQQDMGRFAEALEKSEQNQFWNIGYLFVCFYYFIFRRLSHGATRLQEIQADRVAVRTCGPEEFIAGLNHVVRRSVEFDYFVSQKVGRLGRGRYEVENLYGLHNLQHDLARDEVEAMVKAAIEAPTTADDTHPSPVERFRYAQRLRGRYRLPADGEMWDLLGDREHLYNEMSKLFNRELCEANRG